MDNDEDDVQGYTNSTPRGYKKCVWCGRTFSDAAAEHHIPFCRDKAKDLGSQNRTPRSTRTQRANEYAKTIPKPGTRRSSMKSPTRDTSTSKEENHGYGSRPHSARSSHSSREEGIFPDINSTPRTSGRTYMNEPYVHTASGLHTPSSSPRRSSSYTGLGGVTGRRFNTSTTDKPTTTTYSPRYGSASNRTPVGSASSTRRTQKVY